MIAVTFTTLILASTAASAIGLLGGVLDLSEAAELYLQKEVSCLNGYASAAICTRDKIEHVSYAPVQAHTGTGGSHSEQDLRSFMDVHVKLPATRVCGIFLHKFIFFMDVR